MKMKMSQTFANALMDALATLAICANGRMPETFEEIEATQCYAQNAYLKLCNEWEEVMGEEWEVIPDESITPFDPFLEDWLEGEEELPF